jgi:hypothetical protein
MLVLTVLMSDLANLWIARLELEHALESAALAAVEHWGKNGDSLANRNAARSAGVSFALANNVRGIPVVIAANGGGAGTNENGSCGGSVVILGNITGTTFNAGTAPGSNFGVKTQATRNVLSLWKPIFGTSQPYKVSAQTYAFYDSSIPGPARLVTITTFICP